MFCRLYTNRDGGYALQVESVGGLNKTKGVCAVFGKAVVLIQLGIELGVCISFYAAGVAILIVKLNQFAVLPKFAIRI